MAPEEPTDNDLKVLKMMYEQLSSAADLADLLTTFSFHKSRLEVLTELVAEICLDAIEELENPPEGED